MLLIVSKVTYLVIFLPNAGKRYLLCKLKEIILQAVRNWNFVILFCSTNIDYNTIQFLKILSLFTHHNLYSFVSNLYI